VFDSLKINPMQRVILNALMASHRALTTTEIVAYVYGRSVGPISAITNVQTAISGLRKALDGTGYQIPKAKPHPGRPGEYRLIRTIGEVAGNA
jgi:hypothetical protein